MKETKKKEKSGNNRMNKKVAVVVLILAVYFGYQLANIYVPEKFEGKAFYKFIYVIIRIAAIIARFFESIGLGNEAYNIRLLSSFHAPMPKQDESVLAKNILIEGIEVRTYTPIVEDVNPLWPVMIFYHGGGFFMGEINAYDYYLFEFVKRLNMTILSVRYRLAPENPFPTPIDDCYKITQHIINNHEKFHADLSRLVVAGDSAGGTIVSALTQRLARENGTTQPKIQVLVYPLVQFANAKLPAYVRYAPTGVTGSSRIGIEKYSKWYFGIINQTDLIISIYDRNEHFALIEDEKEYNRIVSYLNVDRIDHKYKAHANYYENRVKTYPRKLPENSELRDNPQLVEFFKQLFKPEVSPLFAPESDLKNLPKAYFILLEWDFLKDEGLLYASRLKEAGVDVHIAFYENAYHGIASSIEVRDFVVARTMQDDLIRYLTQFL